MNGSGNYRNVSKWPIQRLDRAVQRICKDRKDIKMEEEVGNPQKLTQLSSRSHPIQLVEKRAAQKDTIIDITSDSQVSSNFPYRWCMASLTFNNYFCLFLYLYITINNNTPRLKTPKNQNRRAAIKLPGDLN